MAIKQDHSSTAWQSLLWVVVETNDITAWLGTALMSCEKNANRPPSRKEMRRCEKPKQTENGERKRENSVCMGEEECMTITDTEGMHGNEK